MSFDEDRWGQISSRHVVGTPSPVRDLNEGMNREREERNRLATACTPRSLRAKNPYELSWEVKVLVTLAYLLILMCADSFARSFLCPKKFRAKDVFDNMMCIAFETPCKLFRCFSVDPSHLVLEQTRDNLEQRWLRSSLSHTYIHWTSTPCKVSYE